MYDIILGIILFFVILPIAYILTMHWLKRLYHYIFDSSKSKPFNLSDYYESSKDITTPDGRARFNEEIKNFKPKKTPAVPKCDTIVTSILSNIVTFDIDDPAEQSEEFRVAGITFHDFANSPDGIVYGYAQRDPTNPHDPNAIALYSWDDRQLGFIPRDQQSDFNDFTSEDAVPLICYINHFINDEGDLTPSGTVTLYRGTEGSLKVLLTTTLETDITSLL